MKTTKLIRQWISTLAKKMDTTEQEIMDRLDAAGKQPKHRNWSKA